MTILQLGRNKSHFDERDYDLKLFAPRLWSAKTEMMWDYPAVALDQGQDPWCVGFSIANWRINLPTFTPQTYENGKEYYKGCKIIDGQPGAQNGSTVRTAAKYMMSQGMISAYAFAMDIPTMDYWLLEKGSLIVGTLWTNDMFYPNKDNIITPTGDNVGGHAWIINGIKPGWKHGVTSWGAGFGDNGGFWISDADWLKIFKYDAEVMTAVELTEFMPPDPIPDTNTGCGNTAIGKMLKKLL